MKCPHCNGDHTLSQCPTWKYLEQHTVLVSDLAKLLVGPCYMNPPDGGDVSVLEQLARMAEDAAKWRATDNVGVHNAALEEAAQICDKRAKLYKALDEFDRGMNSGSMYDAAAIRKAKK